MVRWELMATFMLQKEEEVVGEVVLARCYR
jgi:hypothetical protein